MATFEEIYEKYFSDVYRFILRMSNSHFIAEEITQETFFKALKSIDKFHGNEKVKVWLCQIAKNTYYSYCKYLRNNSEEAENLGIDNHIEKSLIDKDKAIKIHKILHSLEEPYKEVFTLRMFGELSFSQIGEILNKTDSWSRVVFYRAKTKLQDKMIGEENNE